MENNSSAFAIRISLTYGLAAAIWILSSDSILVFFNSDPEAIKTLSVYKGWLFVGVTVMLLHRILNKQIDKWHIERNAAELKIRQSEAKFSRLFQQCPVAMALVDPAEYRIADINKAFETLYGYSKAEVIGRSSRDLNLYIHPDERERVIQRLAAGILLTDFPLAIRRKDGIERTVEVKQGHIELDGRRFLLATSTDITDRKQAEEAQRRSEERFATAFRSNPNPLVISRIHDGTIIDVNDTFLHFFGWSRAEVIGRTSRSLLMFSHPEDRDRAINVLRQNGRLHDYEVDIQLRTGEERVVLLSAEVLQLEEGEAFLTILQDITERKRAEESLRKLNNELATERSRWQGVVEGMAEEIWVCNNEEKISLINLPEVTAMDLEEFEGRTLQQVLEEVDIYYPDGTTRPADEAPLLRSFRTGETVRGEEIMRYRRSGRKRYRQFSSAPTRNAETGVINGSVAVVRDITNLRQAEEALRESEQRIRAMFDNAALGIVEVDADGRFLHVNKRLCQILGYSADALIGKTVHDITAPEDQQRSDALNAALYRGEMTLLDYEKRYLRQDGSPVWVHVTVSAVRDTDGVLVRSIGTVEDITKRRVAEDEIEHLARFTLEDPNPILRADALGMVTYANPASAPVLAEWNCAVGEFPPPPWQQVISDSISTNRRTMKTIQCGEREFSLLFAPVIDGPYVNIYAMEDTERNQAMRNLVATLKEKELLLREVHHRVKNNMQVISSLLRLQAHTAANAALTAMLSESVNRIHSMSLVHELLYGNADMTKISSRKYINALMSNLQHSHGGHGRRITLDVKIDREVILNIETAISCGLIINELVTNSYKYAFPDDRSGSITVQLHPMSDNTFQLVVADTGIGLPPGFDITRTKTLGTQLVYSLVTGLQGTLDITSVNGTRYTITFSNVDYKPRYGKEPDHAVQ